MRYAIISDIHANKQAWQAVKLDIEKAEVDGVICLGDVVGYGPDPAPVLESVIDTANDFVLGNHDAVVCNKLDASCFNDEARFIIDWTRQQLNDDAVQFFSEVPMAVAGEDFLCVHAEAAWPDRFQYIFEAPESLESFDACEEKIIFIGHTHIPGVIELQAPGDAVMHPPEDFVMESGRRYMVNVGSVGDPRNGDIRASYVIFDEAQEQVQFRKVPFDVKAYGKALINSKLPTRPILFRHLKDRPEDHGKMTPEDQEAAHDGMGFTARFAADQPHETTRAKVGTGHTRKIKVKRRSDEDGVTVAGEGRLAGKANWLKQKKVMVLILLAGFLAGLAILFLVLQGIKNSGPDITQQPETFTSPTPAETTPQPPPNDPEQEALEKQHREWQNMISKIDIAAQRNPEEFSTTLNELAAIQKKATGTPTAREAQVVMDQLKRERRERISDALADLEVQATGLVASNQFAQALEMVNEYSGPFADETALRRSELAQRYNRTWNEFKNLPEQKAARQYESLCAELAPLMFNLDEPALRTALKHRIEQARREHPGLDLFPLFKQLKNLPAALSAIESQIMNSFTENLGRIINVQLLDGPLRLKVTEVSEETVHAYQIIGSGGAIGTGKDVLITYSTLAPGEKARRLSKLDTAETPNGLLLQGLFLAEAGKPDRAARLFEKLDGTLGAAVQAQLSGASNE